MGKLFLFFIGFVVLGVLWLARSPLLIDHDTNDVVKVTHKVQVAEPPPKEEVKEEKSVQADDQLSSFEPEPISAQAELTQSGFGWGSASGGMAVGGDGLGTSSGQLAKESAEQERAVRVVDQPPFEYPTEARAKGQTGFVTLRVLVSEEGTVNDVQVVQSTPQGVFERAAREAVRRWRFTPALSKGRAVAVWSVQKIRFSLE